MVSSRAVLRKKLAALPLSLALLGCAAVGPDYAPPVTATEAQFVGGGTNELYEAAQVAWWKSLSDPLLNEYVAKGLDQNLDLAASLERIEAARAQLRQTGINAQLSGDLTGALQRADAGNGLGAANSATVGADAAFVFDIFGGIRRSVEQAEAGVEQAQFDAATAKLGFLAEIVSSYIQARYFQNAAEIARQTVVSQTRTVELVQFRIDAGDATQLELQQAQQALDRTRADLPLLRANFEAQAFRVATLLAEPGTRILTRMQRGAGLPQPRRSGAVGVPADLIRNRPDIRSAERALAASTAAIGIAEAQLYPSIFLAGTVSATRTSAANVDAWGFGPSIAFPLLNRGTLTARRDAAVSQAKQAEIAWRNAVLNAVEDVQSALSLVRGLSGQVASLQRVERSAIRLRSLSVEAYQAGAAPITDILDADQAISNARLSLLGARRDFALSWAELQISTGKGWLAN